MLKRIANKIVVKFSVKTLLLIATNLRYLKLFIAFTKVSFSVIKAIIFIFLTFKLKSCDFML